MWLDPACHGKQLRNAIVGALRHTIHDHGAITPEKIESAAKRIYGMLKSVHHNLEVQVQAKPYFSFEGIDGSGKTSVMEAVAKELCIRGYEVKSFRCPHTDYRKLLFSQEYENKLEMQMLFCAAAVRLIDEIKDSLSRGYVVLCDRGSDSAGVYGSAEGLDRSLLHVLNSVAYDNFWPNKTCWLDVSLDVSKARLSAASRDESHAYDVARDEFKQQLIDGYTLLWERNRPRIHRINANRDFDAVVQDCLNVLLPELEMIYDW